MSSKTEEFLIIDTDKEIEAMIKKLDGLRNQIGAPVVLRDAVNTAARRVRTRMNKDVLKRYALQDVNVLKDPEAGAPKILKANETDVTATIQSRGPMLDMMSFMTRPNTKTGAAAAQVLNSGSLKMLEANGQRAFVTQFRSGHVAIVQRKPPQTYGATKEAVARKREYGASTDMTKLKKLLSPAVPHMLGNEEVRAKAETLVFSYLQREIEKKIERINSR